MVRWCILVHSGPLVCKTTSKHKPVRILTVGTRIVGASRAPLSFCSCCCCCLSHTSLLFVCLFVCVYVCSFLGSKSRESWSPSSEATISHKPFEKWQKEFLSSRYLDFWFWCFLALYFIFLRLIWCRGRLATMWRVSIPWPWKKGSCTPTGTSPALHLLLLLPLLLLIIIIPTHKKLHHNLLWFCAHPRTVVYDLPLPEVPKASS